MLTTASIALLLLAAPELAIPTAPGIELDGAVGADEWKTARAFTSADREFRLQRCGPWLCVGMSGKGPYRGEVFTIVVSDDQGAWQTLYLGMAGTPSQPPALRVHAPFEQLQRIARNPKIPIPPARGTLCRMRLADADSWSVEYKIRLTSLGIGRGDARAFRVRLVMTPGDSDDPPIVFPEGTTIDSTADAFATLTSPDGWGVAETWARVSPEESQEFDDAELLGLLSMEQSEQLQKGELGELVISSAVRPRSRKKINQLRTRMEEAMERNPGLPSWHYFLGRLLHEGNLYEDAGKVIEGIPAIWRSFPAFAHLRAEHYYDTGRPEKALEVCRENPRVHGMDLVFHRATVVKNMMEEEAAADETAKRAGAPELPVVRFTTARGTFDVELFEDIAPHAVTSFVDLVMRKQYFDGLTFHDVHGNVGARFGDPRTKSAEADENAADGPKWRLKSDAATRPALAGRLMTLPIREGGQHGSQFILTLAPVAQDTQGAVVFGRVVKGMDVVLSLEQGDRIGKVEVVRRRSHQYDPTHSRQE